MPTVADLGRWYKNKKPGKYSKSDEEVGRILKARYPDKYAHYEDTLLAPYHTQSVTDPNLTNKFLDLWGIYNSGMGGFLAWFRGLSQNGRNNFLRKIGENQALLIEQANAISDYALARQRAEIELQRFAQENLTAIEQLIAYAKLYTQAAEQGLTIESYDDVQREHYLGQQRMTEREHEMRLLMDAERQKVENEIMLLEAKVRLDKQNSDNILENSKRMRMREYTILDLLQDKLIEATLAYENEYHESLKKIRENHMRFLEKKINEQYSRLVQN